MHDTLFIGLVAIVTVPIITFAIYILVEQWKLGRDD